MGKINSASVIKKAFSGGIWVLGSTIFQNISQFILLIVLSRVLSPNDFGVASISLLIVSFFSILTQFGIPQAIVQKKNLEDEEVRQCVTLVILSLVIGITVLNLLSNKITLFFNNENLKSIFLLITITIICQALASIPEALLQRNLKFKQTSLIELISYTLGYGVIGIILAFVLRNYFALVFANLFYNLFKLVLLIILKPSSLKISIKFNFRSDTFKLGFGFNLSRIIAYFSVQSDNIVVGRTLGTESLGIYSRIYQLISLPAKVTGMFFDKLLFSSLSRIQDDKIEIRRVYFYIVKLSGIVLSFLSVFVFVLAKEIIYLLLGEQWAISIVPLKLFAFSIFFRTAYKIGETIAISTGFIYKRIWIQIIYAVSVIIFSIVGSKFGINGVVIGINIAVFLNYLLITMLTNKLLNVKFIEFIKIFIPVGMYTFLYFVVINLFYHATKNMVPSFLVVLLGGILTMIIIYFPLKDDLNKAIRRLKR